MNNEFKKIKNNEDTRYVLENASSGGTSSGSVASVSMLIGSTRKRGDNILAQEADKKTVPVSTLRNFVAKNAKTGGAGQHKDKKKAEKQGDVKHRKPFAEQGVAEGLDEAVGSNYLYHATSPAGLKGILQSGYIGAQQTAQAATNAQTKLPSVAVTRDWNYAAGSSRSSEGVGQGAVIVFDRNSIESKYKTFGTSQSSMIKGLPNTTADSPQMKKLAMQTKFKDANKNGKLDYDELPAGAGGAALKHNYFRPKAGSEAEEAVVVPKGNLPLQGSMIGFWVDPKSELASDLAIMNDPRRLDMVRPNQFVKAKQEQGVAEGFNGEYDDEAGMAHTNLLTSARAVMGLLKTIDDKDNLPEWVQEKIAKAEMMLVGVWDYLQSQKEQGIDPQQDANEADERTMSRAAKGNEKYGKDGMKALAKAGRDGASDEKLDAIRDKHDKYDEGIEEAEKKGLYYYVNKRKKAGTSRPASSSKAPSAQAWKDAAKTAKKESVDPYFESLRAQVEELAKK